MDSPSLVRPTLKPTKSTRLRMERQASRANMISVMEALARAIDPVAEKRLEEVRSELLELVSIYCTRTTSDGECVLSNVAPHMICIQCILGLFLSCSCSFSLRLFFLTVVFILSYRQLWRQELEKLNYPNMSENLAVDYGKLTSVQENCQFRDAKVLCSALFHFIRNSHNVGYLRDAIKHLVQRRIICMGCKKHHILEAIMLFPHVLANFDSNLFTEHNKAMLRATRAATEAFERTMKQYERKRERRNKVR